MTGSVTYRVAPPGFSREQWREFRERGIVIIEDALTPEEVAHYRDAVDRVCARDPGYVEGTTDFRVSNAVESDPAVAELIDHPRHVGYAYDLYGEMLKIIRSDIFVRPRDTDSNMWHPDSPRATPYRVFAPELPLRMSIGYWLTDLPRAGMGNFVYLPGSHRQQYLDGYYSHEPAPGEEILCGRAGTMTVYDGNLWHRVEPNRTGVVRKNIFIAYCPSWVCAGDRLLSDPEWLATLNREQRIIMRSYPYPHDYTNPSADDFPLYLDRETGADTDAGVPDRIPLRLRKRRTAAERFTTERRGGDR